MELGEKTACWFGYNIDKEEDLICNREMNKKGDGMSINEEEEQKGLEEMYNLSKQIYEIF